ncbi:hypothetical protein [Bradyrhizobium sp. Ai1a-2]|uniref:hypothetical protein n=1 Tax=Bradyrhizobium sp. Ai1a-2 TaxID=196490 RepID=UPI0004846C7E|nr:hypothetical protein [Bradyrhizobium sp. Ai1a-2]
MIFGLLGLRLGFFRLRLKGWEGTWIRNKSLFLERTVGELGKRPAELAPHPWLDSHLGERAGDAYRALIVVTACLG